MQHAHIQALFIDIFDKVMTNISVILSNIFKKYITEQNIDQHGILRVCKKKYKYSKTNENIKCLGFPRPNPVGHGYVLVRHHLED